MKKKRARCGRGHLFTKANTRIRLRNGLKLRVCRACESLTTKAYRETPKGAAVRAIAKANERLHSSGMTLDDLIRRQLAIAMNAASKGLLLLRARRSK